MTDDDVIIRKIERDERAGLARVTAYRPDVGEVTITVMLTLADSSAITDVARAALDRKRRDIEALSFREQ